MVSNTVVWEWRKQAHNINNTVYLFEPILYVSKVRWKLESRTKLMVCEIVVLSVVLKLGYVVLVFINNNCTSMSSSNN